MSLVGFVIVQAEDKIVNWVATTHLLQEIYYVLFVIGWSNGSAPYHSVDRQLRIRIDDHDHLPLGSVDGFLCVPTHNRE